MLDRKTHRLIVLRKLVRALAQVLEAKRLDAELDEIERDSAERARRARRASQAKAQKRGTWKKPGETPREYIRRLGREAKEDKA